MGEYKEKYKAMTNEQFSAYLAKDRVRLETEAAERKAAREERQSPGAARYNKAIEEFTMKHPMKGIKVTMKAMKLLPKNFGTTADAKQK